MDRVSRVKHTSRARRQPQRAPWLHVTDRSATIAPVGVSAKDRDHFARIGAAMTAKKTAQRQEALRISPAERVATGFLLGAVPRSPGIERALDERAEQQIELARKGRHLRTRNG